MNRILHTVNPQICVVLVIAIFFSSGAVALPREAEGAAGSPFRVNLAVDIPVTGISAAAALAMFLYGESVTRTHYYVPSRSSVNQLDRSVIGNDSDGFRLAGDIGSVAIPAAALCLSLVEYPQSGWSGVIEDFLLVGEALAVSSCLENIAVNLFPRRRPYMYDLGLKIRNEQRTDWDTRSFYSGHAASPFAATTAFSFIFTVRRPHSPWVPVVWATSIAASSLVAISRPLAGQHFWTDVIAGSVIGITLGILVPALHLASFHNGTSEVRIVISGTGVTAACSF